LLDCWIVGLLDCWIVSEIETGNQSKRIALLKSKKRRRGQL